jgi:hypothetical protein
MESEKRAWCDTTSNIANTHLLHYDMNISMSTEKKCVSKAPCGFISCESYIFFERIVLYSL